MATDNSAFAWAMTMVRAGWQNGTPNPVLSAFNTVVDKWNADHPGEPMPFTLDQLIAEANRESMQNMQESMGGVSAEQRALDIAGAKKYNGHGIYWDNQGQVYRSSGTGNVMPFDAALWDQGQGSLNHGAPDNRTDARAYAYWLGQGAAYDAANPQNS